MEALYSRYGRVSANTVLIGGFVMPTRRGSEVFVKLSTFYARIAKAFQAHYEMGLIITKLPLNWGS
jgi:hypothetical protein